jgi:hypothetical protein
MNRSQRKSALNEMVRRKILSEDGLHSLIKTTDPFHDIEVDCVGIPDALPEKSIVREVRKSVTIGSPLLDKSLPWDCHIFTLPERNTTPSDEISGNTSGTLSAAGIYSIGDGGTQFPTGPIVIVTCPAGAATTPAGDGWNPASATVSVLDYNDYYQGQSREIFSGFEVHNVTNQLNVGGTVTVYRMPQFTYPSAVSIVGTEASDFANTFVQNYALISRMPPGDLQEALLLPGTRQWEARDGCYCVETFDMDHNLPQAGTLAQRLYVAGDFAGGKDFTQAPLPALASFYGNSGPQAVDNAWACLTRKPVAKDTSGAYFTGLPGQSQLTLTVRKGIETFPTFKDSLVTLARSTPDHDPAFFELYKRIAQELPPGVAVGENASGDFWDKILGIIGDVAPMIGPSLGPLGGAVGNVVSLAAKAGQKARNKPKPDDTNFKGGKAMVKAPANTITNQPRK